MRGLRRINPSPSRLEIKRVLLLSYLKIPNPEQSGAVEACWAHNPEVRGSKPRSATLFAFFSGLSSVSQGSVGSVDNTFWREFDSISFYMEITKKPRHLINKSTCFFR